MDVIQKPLTEIFKASYALGYVPQAWRKVNVVFILKAGGRCETRPKSYRPISLSSFLLKTMERILDLHIRCETLMLSPLHYQQHAYQKGKSTETALSCIVNTVEKAISNKEIALCAFLDIEGAFDNTSFASIERAAYNKGCEPATVKWIKSMLQSRQISAMVGGAVASVKAMRGCPQGGV